MATATKKTKADPVQECPYGARCYRKNPQHLAEFSHPKKAKSDDDSSDTTDGPSSSSPSDDSSLPPCKYGAKCYRNNLLHFAEYSHPTKKDVSNDSNSGDDTDPVSDEDKAKPALKDIKSTDILKRGMSLVKSFSAMSEAERKELIKKAFEAKKQLQEELAKTKSEVKKKEQEVEKLQKEVAAGLLLMEGEQEALDGDTIKYFDLFAERDYKEGSAAQTHFRLAESQFYRLLVGNSAFKITKVQYVVNPSLTQHFKQCREDLKQHRGEQFSYPVLAFHGTQEEYITPICEQGFKIPGESGHKHRTDTGWYGKGVYFSEYPSYSMGYISGSSKLLLCQVLPGKVYQCTRLIHGASLKKEHDSHMSPDKMELVIFNKYHILPAYIVHYTSAQGQQFKYEDPKKAEAKGMGKKPAAGKAAGKAGKAAGKATGKMVKPPTKFSQCFDSAKLLEKYCEVKDMDTSSVFDSTTIQFTGTFCASQKEMLQIVQNHGSYPPSKVVFSILVASETEFKTQTNKVQTAIKKMVPIVAEMYIYDSILAGKMLPKDKYLFK